MSHDKSEVTVELFNHFFLEIMLGWEHQWKVVVLSFNLLHCKCHKTKFNRGRSYQDFMD